MARLLRVYQKKRGHRRTGNKMLGSLGETLFFGFFLCVGLAAFVLVFLSLVVPEWRANRHFVRTKCTIVNSHVAISPGYDGVTYRPDIRIRYTVDDKEHEVVTYDVTRLFTSAHDKAVAAVEQFRPGLEVDCWYDPINPARAVLVRGYSGWLYLLLLIPLSFIVIGGGGLIYNVTHWGASVERRVASTQKPTTAEIFEREPDTHPDFPHVPSGANLRNSPGTALAYRLPVAAAPAWRLFAVLSACVIWNGIVIALAVMTVQGHIRGTPDWALTTFLAPFALLGLGLVAYLIRQILLTTGVGVTRLEISDHRLVPGGRYELFFSQAGRLDMRWLELSLECREQATYHQGTDTRTETRCAYQQRVFRHERFEILPELPFEQQCPLEMPAVAMHSFKADHNEINWLLVVRGAAVGWPDFERWFPVVVCPQARGAER